MKTPRWHRKQIPDHEFTAWLTDFALVVMEEQTKRALDPNALTPADAPGLEAEWAQWVRTFFPRMVSDRLGRPVPFAPHHAEMWEWAWSVELGVRPRPLVSILARGGAKSTTAELITTALGALGKRKYCLYVCEVQERADDHVQSIAAAMGSDSFAQVYPAAASRAVDRVSGNIKGWRRNRLACGNGYTVDALGLDVASRGAKLEENRPDLIVLDDIDDHNDSPGVVLKKLRTISKSVLGTGGPDLAVLAVQNLIHPGGVFASLATDKADFLADRYVIGPIPALRNLVWSHQERVDGRLLPTIIEGEPTWAGQDVAACQSLMDAIGLSTFLDECQHELDHFEGGMFADVVKTVRRCSPEELVTVHRLTRIVVACDPAVTNTKASDANGIQADGLCGHCNRIVRLYSWEKRSSPLPTMKLALAVALDLGAEALIVETNQGGDTWDVVYVQARSVLREDIRLVMAGADPDPSWEPAYSARLAIIAAKLRAGGAIRFPRFEQEKAANASKLSRGQQMLADYERDRFIHLVGPHGMLEGALARFGIREPYDLVDSAYWSWRYLATLRQTPPPDPAAAASTMVYSPPQPRR